MEMSAVLLRLRPMRVQTRAENTIAWAPRSHMAVLRKPGIQAKQGPGRLLAYAPHRLPAKRQNRPCDKLESAALNELVAQVVEQRPFKAWVLGSNPSELTILINGPAAFSEKCPARNLHMILAAPSRAARSFPADPRFPLLLCAGTPPILNPRLLIRPDADLN